MGCVDEFCSGCVYLGTLSGGLYCAFCDVTGHMKGCKCGEGCIRKVEGGRKYSPSFFTHEKKEQEKRKEEKKIMTELEYCERERIRKSEMKDRTRAILQGKQRAVLLKYKNERGLTNEQFAELLGVKRDTVGKWITEYYRADWEKLKILGIEKPIGLE